MHRVQLRQLRHHAARLVEQEVGDHGHHRRLPHEAGERHAQAVGALERHQPLAELIRLEAVNHLVLADARPDRGELLELRVEGDQAEAILEEHRRHADRPDRPGDRRGDRDAVDAAPRR